MSEAVSCRAVKRNGKRCSNRPQIAGFCGVHYPKPEPAIHNRLREGAKTAGQIITVAGGAVKLIEIIVKLWQSLPFGPGPRMPDDFEYLVGEVGPFWPDMPTEYPPFTKGPNTVNWRQARAIYDKAAAVMQHRVYDDAVLGAGATFPEDLEGLVASLLNDMEPPFRQMLLKKLGSLAESDEAGYQIT